MQIIDFSTVVVFTSSELKQVLEEENKYKFIYFGDNITLEEDILINQNKEEIVINGTYLNQKYTLTINGTLQEDGTITSYNIEVNSNNKKITIKNLNIVSSGNYGAMYCKSSTDYKTVMLEYINVKFNGIKMVYNPQGSVRILDSNITIENTNEIGALEVVEATGVEIGGNTDITSSSTTSSLFKYMNTFASYFKILPNSRVNLRSDNKEFLTGSYRLDFKILHDAEVNLVTANGFASNTIYGTINTLIDKRASFTFIENKHLRIPMWSMYGNLTVNEGANFLVLNTYAKTPSDNYNIHFKGSSCKLILDNPNSFVIYTKNANVLYTNNALEYSLKISRLNMWSSAVDFSLAGGINNLPEYSWYKENQNIEITGTFTKEETTVTSHNLTEEELVNLSEITNFSFQNRKQFSIGKTRMNLHPVDNLSTTISGHTIPFSSVLVNFNGKEEIVDADDYGLFSVFLTEEINDNTPIEILTCVPNSFIYTARKIITPYSGELSFLEADNNILFSLTPILFDPVILPKAKETVLKIIDSRVTKTSFKIYASLEKEIVSENGFILERAVIFKKLDDEIIYLNEDKNLVYENAEKLDAKEAQSYILTYSTDKGILLSLESNALEVNEEYMTSVLWQIEE